MSGQLAGRTVVVTAAGQGIGRATAELFAREGATVWGTDINATALTEVEGVQTAALDVTDKAAVRRFFAQLERVDVLFNCAGIVAKGSILDSKDEDWSRSIDLNIISMVHGIQAVLPGMIKQRRGSIINMASIASSIKGVPDRCVYGTTKAAVIGLTKAVAADFVKEGIRCNAICPGTVDTPSLRERLEETGDFEGAWADFVGRQPMGRLGQADEIAALALYLASDASGFVSGQTIAIDGGWTI
jgi:2-keto-3-deoxy-L-fuconate dehydrogenase